MLGEAAKVPVEVVGYKGSGPLLTDLMGGQVPIAVDTFDTQVTQHEAGEAARAGDFGRQAQLHGADHSHARELGVNLVGTGWNTLFAPQHGARHGAAPVRAGAGGDEGPGHAAEICRLLEPVVSSAAQTEAMLKTYRAQWAPVQRSGFKP